MGFGSTLKKFGSYALPIAGALTGNPFLAAAGGAGGAALGGGGWKGALAGGAGGFVGSKLLGAFGGNSATTPSAGMSSAAQSLGPSAMQFAGGFPQLTSPGGGSIQPSSGGGGGGGLLSSFGGLIKKNPLAAAGIGTGILGMFAGKSPKVPGLPQSAQDYASQVRGGGSDLNKLATSKLSEGLNQPFQQVSADEETAALRPIEQQQEQELHQLTGLYKNLRPGTDPSTDSTYQRDLGLLNDRYAKLKGDTVSQLHRQVYNDYQGQQLNRIGAAGQLDSQTQAAMQQVAQWDIDQISTQFGVDYADAAQLKQFLMTEGATLFNSSVDPNQALTSAALKKYLGVA